MQPSTEATARLYPRGNELSRASNLAWAMTIVLLVFSVSEFVIRGPVRFVRFSEFNDFTSPYVQTIAWTKGIDPYSPSSLFALWPSTLSRPSFLAKDLADGSLAQKRGIPTAYPPTVFVLLAPLVLLPYGVASSSWLAINVFSCVVAVAFLASKVGLCDRQILALFFACSLALAPLHTGLATGSIVIAALGPLAIGTWLIDRKQELAAGVLFGIVVALKPQIGLPFVAYYLWRRRWSAAISSLAVVLFIALLALGQLSLTHSEWIESYRYDNAVLFAPGSLGDFTEANPIRFSLINLQVPLSTLIRDRRTVNVLASLVTVFMGAAWLALTFRNGHKRNELLELGALVALSMLPIYHRGYDASLLIFPLAWIFAAFSARAGLLARLTALCIAFFLVPGGSALEKLQSTNWMPSLQHSRLWRTLVMPHQVWALLLLALVLLAAIWQSRLCEAGRQKTCY